jgi:hypothetical protein
MATYAHWQNYFSWNNGYSQVTSSSSLTNSNRAGHFDWHLWALGFGLTLLKVVDKAEARGERTFCAQRNLRLETFSLLGNQFFWQKLAVVASGFRFCRRWETDSKVRTRVLDRENQIQRSSCDTRIALPSAQILPAQDLEQDPLLSAVVCVSQLMKLDDVTDWSDWVQLCSSLDALSSRCHEHKTTLRIGLWHGFSHAAEEKRCLFFCTWTRARNRNSRACLAPFSWPAYVPGLSTMVSPCPICLNSSLTLGLGY